MGSTTFVTIANGKTAREAFAAAREQALYDHGHSGYSGTIAEKDSFTVVGGPAKMGHDIALALGDKMMNEDDPAIADKWGPAGCIALDDGKFLFFGWASC